VEDAIFKSYLNKEALEDALVRLIAIHSLPLSTVEWPELHALLRICNPIVRIPQAHSTITLAVHRQWHNHQDTIRQNLRTAISPIHISLDIWTSPNTYLFLGIVAHFVRKDTNFRSKALLGLREVGSSHGTSQWEILRPILYEYEIVRQLGTIVGDNSGTNDTLCQSIEAWYESEGLLKWSAERNRMRCIGHILNLIVQSFFIIKLKDYEPYDKAEAGGVEQSHDAQSIQQMSIHSQNNPDIRKKFRTEMDALGKLHNIVVHIRASGGRMKSWEKTAPRRIPLDNRTRWNSWYQMLLAAHENQMHIDCWTKEYDELEQDCISKAEWEWLTVVRTLMAEFHFFTVQNEGDQKGISFVLLTLYLTELEIKKAEQAFKNLMVSSFLFTYFFLLISYIRELLRSKEPLHFFVLKQC
jgi:hypothetical protein